jgi:hypothetical protein
MKKTLVAIAALLMTAATYGQVGTVNFANRLSGVFDAAVTVSPAGTVGIGTIGGTVAQLLVVSGTSMVPVGTAIAFRGTTDPLAKYFDGGATDVTGTTAGGTVTLAVRISGPGVTQTDSAPWTQALGGGTLPAENMVNMKAFSVVPVVPEPTTIALGLLGAAALFASRRKS